METKQVKASPGEAAILEFQESTAKKLLAMHQEIDAIRLLVGQVFAFTFVSAMSSTQAILLAVSEKLAAATDQDAARAQLAGIEKEAHTLVLEEFKRWEGVAFQGVEQMLEKGREEIRERERNLAAARGETES